jgi:L-aspartate oxidase
VSTGDGVAIAARAGAEVRDLEFVQFHPTALMVPGAPRFLISEAVRGEGAHLIDAAGRRFVFDDHPSGELAPRDVVSRSIFRHLQRSGESCVWLDLRVIERDRVLHRFPNIIQVCRDWGVDVFSEPIPVGPAAHYWMGGVTCDAMNRSSLPGLYVVGETASTGVHGANRLASNSLLECVVFGAQLRNVELLDSAVALTKVDQAVAELAVSAADQAVILELRDVLPRLLWGSAGITRIGASLEVGIESVEAWRSRFLSLPMSQALMVGDVRVRSEDESWVRSWGELRNLLEVGRSILRSALFRTESRGGHFREDFPDTSEAWAKHSVMRGDELKLL